MNDWGSARKSLIAPKMSSPLHALLSSAILPQHVKRGRIQIASTMERVMEIGNKWVQQRRSVSASTNPLVSKLQQLLLNAFG